MQVNFCFKLGKNAAETYGMLQTSFGPCCMMNWASVFEWHKRFKEGRESVRDDERCGSVMFWPVDPAKMPFKWYTGRKWHILMAVMRGNRLERVTSELDDSYFRSMTITQAIPKKAEVAHPGPQISEVVVEACPYQRVGVWR